MSQVMTITSSFRMEERDRVLSELIDWLVPTNGKEVQQIKDAVEGSTDMLHYGLNQSIFEIIGYIRDGMARFTIYIPFVNTHIDLFKSRAYIYKLTKEVDDEGMVRGNPEYLRTKLGA